MNTKKKYESTIVGDLYGISFILGDAGSLRRADGIRKEILKPATIASQKTFSEEKKLN